MAEQTFHIADSAYALTIEGYGQRERLVHLGKGHRNPDVLDQAKHDGEFILAVLDNMKAREAQPVCWADLAKRSRLDPEAVERVAQEMCKAVVGAKDLKAREFINEPLPVSDEVRLKAVYALRDVLGF